MDDLISRQQAIDAVADLYWLDERLLNFKKEIDLIFDKIKTLPSAQPEIEPISYKDCANAMLKMWMDNVLTDGEYNRIMYKLNKFDAERRTDE